MKYLKQIAALLLAVLLVCSLSLTALADDETPEQPETPASSTNNNNGKITIDNAVVGQTYSVYQILELESFSGEGDTGSYSYKATEAWNNFVTGTSIKNVYLSVNDSGYVTWGRDANVAAFAGLAKEHAATLTGSQGSKKAESSTVEFTGLNLGYYLVVSDMGAVCSLDTTNPTVTIKEKNAAPTVTKEVEEDSKVGKKDSQGKDINAWGSTNDADIGQVVNFKTTINVLDGNPTGYVLHDTMSPGLTFESDTPPVVKIGDRTLTSGTDYELKTSGLTDGCIFEIQFKENVLKTNDVVVVTYSATVNSNAVVGGAGNPNTAKVSYTDSTNTTKQTNESQTKTYTWDVDILKYANGKKENVLQGVKFVILNSDQNKVAKVDANGKLTGWEAVPAAVNGVITWPDGTTLITGEDGKISIDGLDADTYYLREIEALPGFNILSEDKSFTVPGTTKAEDGEELTYTTATVEVENNSGTELPATGGVGTTLFYVVGSVLVLGAVVLLITRKRMKA